MVHGHNPYFPSGIGVPRMSDHSLSLFTYPFIIHESIHGPQTIYYTMTHVYCRLESSTEVDSIIGRVY